MTGETVPDPVRVVRHGEHVAVIEMGEGPKALNLWSPALEGEVFAALDALAADDSVRVIGLRSVGRAFCAGGDLAGVEERLSSTAPLEQEAAALVRRRVLRALSVPKPVVAAINGPCIGVGFALALTCDLRLVSTDVKLQVGFPSRGFVAEHGTSWLLPRIVGLGDALDLLLSSRTVRAEEALAMRLVHRAVAPEELEATLIEVAEALATGVSPRSQAVIKRQVLRDLQLGFADSVGQTALDMVTAFRDVDAREGVESFLQGRPAAFPPLSPSAPLPTPPFPGETPDRP